MADYTVKRFDEMETAFRGAMRRARASLGVTSFGMQLLELPAGEITAYPEHDHRESGQEEVFVALDGEATLEIDGEVVALVKSSAVRIGPTARRKIVRTGAEGVRLLMLSGVPGAPYEPPSFSELGAPAGSS